MPWGFSTPPATAIRPDAPALAAEPILQITDARRRYGDRVALNGISLHIDPGEIYALLGRNGAGKSTLAKAAIGATALDAGTVRVRGADPVSDLAVRRAIGVAPQEIALYPRLTIAENLQAFASIAGVAGSERDGAVSAALELCVCTPRATQRIETLSGGWKRRANLAAALVHRPDLIVLDEPSEGLDAETRAVLSTVLRRQRDDGRAILLISHDAREVAALADRIGVLHAGRLVAEGEPADLLAKAFQGRDELVVRLQAVATSAIAERLAASGLSADADELVWRGLVEDASARARDLYDALAADNAALVELTVRPPGLDALAAQLTEGAP